MGKSLRIDDSLFLSPSNSVSSFSLLEHTPLFHNYMTLMLHFVKELLELFVIKLGDIFVLSTSDY